MPDQLDPQIIDRYLAGEASPEELSRVEAQRAADPAWAATIDAIAHEMAQPTAQLWNVDAAWSKLHPTLDTARAARREPTQSRPELPSRARFRTGWLLAAGLLLAIGATTWRVTRGRIATADSPVFANDIATPNGARQTITLGDGSRVTLNAGSRLRWAKDFDARARDVYLDGEAYFVVTHDSRRPFRVHARGAIAEDVGTRFTVRGYPELPQLEVVVAEGAVSLRRDRLEARDSVIVAAGQLGRVGSSGSPAVESNVAIERWTAWTGGALVLEGLTLEEALPQLERWYDATIVVGDTSLAKRRLTARFHDETLPQMLDALTLALGARWQRNGRSITLTTVKP